MEAIEIDALPDRLQKLPYDVFASFMSDGFAHRGHTVTATDVVDAAMAGIQFAFLEEDEIGEVRAVEAGINGINSHYPEWFGEETENVAMAISESHLSVNRIKDQYWDDELMPDTESVDSWEERYHIAVPIAAIVCDLIQGDRQNDLDVSRDRGKKTLIREICEEMEVNELREEDVMEAAARAVDIKQG